jgi:hypothetical protein
MTDEWKKAAKKLVWVVVASAVLAYGLSELTNTDGIPIFAVILPFPVLYVFSNMFSKKEESEEVNSLRFVIEEYSAVLDEQIEVIKEYEDIFDSQLVELPCICGGNTFKGLFSPNLENMVECEKCHNKYKVTVTYDSILQTDPIDINAPLIPPSPENVS